MINNAINALLCFTGYGMPIISAISIILVGRKFDEWHNGKTT